MSRRRSRTLIFAGIIVGGIAILTGALWYHLRGSRATLPGTTLMQNGPYAVQVSAPKDIAVGQTLPIHFTILKDGKRVDSEADGRALHVVIADASYRDFVHVYPVEPASAPGRFQVTHTFTQPGPHRVWTELVNTHNAHEQHHGQFAEAVSYADFSVQGESPLPSPHTFIRTAQAVVGGYKVQLTHPPLVAGQAVTIETAVQNARGENVPLLEYEPSIYVMTGPTLEFFRHGHTNPPRNGSIIEITDTFPAAGEYLYWTEIPVPLQDTYEVLQVPFLLTVGS